MPAKKFTSGKHEMLLWKNMKLAIILTVFKMLVVVLECVMKIDVNIVGVLCAFVNINYIFLTFWRDGIFFHFFD